mmetsp:Transcript_11901/g.23894  ORF Transcript_11901/g.23894 Transcript_11901/m.23894 type:complete len:202 (-) Transcript_11901:220-825(-)
MTKHLHSPPNDHQLPVPNSTPETFPLSQHVWEFFPSRPDVLQIQILRLGTSMIPPYREQLVAPNSNSEHMSCSQHIGQTFPPCTDAFQIQILYRLVSVLIRPPNRKQLSISDSKPQKRSLFQQVWDSFPPLTDVFQIQILARLARDPSNHEQLPIENSSSHAAFFRNHTWEVSTPQHFHHGVSFSTIAYCRIIITTGSWLD